MMSCTFSFVACIYNSFNNVKDKTSRSCFKEKEFNRFSKDEAHEC